MLDSVFVPSGAPSTASNLMVARLRIAYEMTAFEVDLFGMAHAEQVEALREIQVVPVCLAVHNALLSAGVPVWKARTDWDSLVALMELAGALGVATGSHISHAIGLLALEPPDVALLPRLLELHELARESGVLSVQDFVSAEGCYFYEVLALALSIAQDRGEDVEALHVVTDIQDERLLVELGKCLKA